MFYKLRNNLANIAIHPILVTSVKHYCHYSNIQSLLSDAFKYQLLVRAVRLWNIIPYHLTTKPSLESFCTAAFQWTSHPYGSTSIQAQIPGASFKILLSFFFLLLLFAVCSATIIC